MAMLMESARAPDFVSCVVISVEPRDDMVGVVSEEVPSVPEVDGGLHTTRGFG